MVSKENELKIETLMEIYDYIENQEYDYLDRKMIDFANKVQEKIKTKIDELNHQENNDDSSKVSRFEVIDSNGRVYTKWGCNVELSYQDLGKTLKVFIKEK